MTCEIFDSFYPPSFFAPLELTAGPNILPSKIHILILIFGTFGPNPWSLEAKKEWQSSCATYLCHPYLDISSHSLLPGTAEGVWKPNFLLLSLKDPIFSTNCC